MKFLFCSGGKLFCEKDKYSPLHDEKINEKISSPEVIKPKNTP